MNTMLLGMAWQRGLVPVGEPAILRAIELNGAAVEAEQARIPVGPDPRRTAGPDEADPRRCDRRAASRSGCADRPRAQALTAYSPSVMPRDIRSCCVRSIARETAVTGAPGRLVARGGRGAVSRNGLQGSSTGRPMHAAASYGEKPNSTCLRRWSPGWTRTTGRRRKIAIPVRVALPLFRVLRHGKMIRGTVLDLFGYQAERRQERALIDQYTTDLRNVLAALTRDNLPTAVALAELPDQIRGFGPVKDANREKAMLVRAQLLETMERPAPMPMAAE